MSSEEEDERDWSDWGDDDNEEATKSLFSDAVLPSARHAIEHDAREYGFDLRRFRAQVRQCTPGAHIAVRYRGVFNIICIASH